MSKGKWIRLGATKEYSGNENMALGAVCAILGMLTSSEKTKREYAKKTVREWAAEGKKIESEETGN